MGHSPCSGPLGHKVPLLWLVPKEMGRSRLGHSWSCRASSRRRADRGAGRSCVIALPQGQTPLMGKPWGPCSPGKLLGCSYRNQSLSDELKQPWAQGRAGWTTPHPHSMGSPPLLPPQLQPHSRRAVWRLVRETALPNRWHPLRLKRELNPGFPDSHGLL